jgi:hypothetical protein
MIEMYEWIRIRAAAAAVCMGMYGIMMLIYPRISGTVYQAVVITMLLAAWLGAMIWLQMKSHRSKDSN